MTVLGCDDISFTMRCGIDMGGVTCWNDCANCCFSTGFRLQHDLTVFSKEAGTLCRILMPYPSLKSL